MTRQNVDWLVAGPAADLRYLTGLVGHPSERMSVLLVPRGGGPIYLAPGLEAPQLANRRDLLDVVTWEETQDPATIAADLLGGDSPTVAVDDTLWSVFLLRLQEALPGAAWSEAGALLRPLRMIKDGREIELMREAARRTDDAWLEFISAPIAGLTELQALRRLLDLTYARGLGPNFGSCGSGPNSASPHHSGNDRVIQPGDAVVFDWGGTLEGYNSDITRTVFVGEPPDDFRRAYAAVLAANEAALQVIRPGVPCEALDLTARAVLEDAGYGEYILHRVGHGLGLSIHEEPYLVLGNTLPLAEGMIFSDEPGIYIPGRWGIRIEDAVLCTDTGAERLNEAPRELTVVG
ncbi:MAG: aminopeptidase P family protein [Thermomicrobiales bacterium]|nr:aminopeptidase P family protein [Thermomicrobiales bacterium]